MRRIVLDVAVEVELEDAPVFVVGVARSGTTLMVRLLSAHPRINNSGETKFKETLWASGTVSRAGVLTDVDGAWTLAGIPACVRLGVDPERVLARFTAMGEPTALAMHQAILEEDALRHGKPRWGDKPLGNLKDMSARLERHPGARVIWMVRDPRATTASRLHATWDNTPFKKMVEHTRSMLEEAASSRDNPRVRVVRYETLVAKPEVVLPRVFAFLGEEWDPAIPERAQAAEFATEKTSFKDAMVPGGPAFRSETVERWRTALTAGQVAHIEAVTRREMRRWGYPPVSPLLPRLRAEVPVQRERLRRRTKPVQRQVRLAVRRLRGR